MSDSNSFIPRESGGQSYSVRELADILGQATNQIATLHKYAASDFKIQTIKVRFYQEHVHSISLMLVQLALPADGAKVNTNAETEAVLDNITTIATQIQFHDIIRQKLEHMIQINQEILEELNQFTHAESLVYQNAPISFLPVVPGVMQCCIAQLDQIKEEYQQVFAQIHLQLEAIKQYADFIIYVSTNQLAELTQKPAMAVIYKHHFAFLSRLADQLQVEATASLMQLSNNTAFEQLLSETTDQLLNVAQKSPVLKSEIKHAATIKHIESVYTMESERAIYNRIFHTAYPIKETKSTDIELF